MNTDILAAKRTPSGNFQGALSTLQAYQLGSIAIKGALEQLAINLNAIDEAIMGCVLQAGQGQAPTRQAALGAHLPNALPCTTVNKMCGSGMRAMMMIHDMIIAGSIKTGIAGGMESMSNAPYLLQKARSGMRLGHGEIIDHMFKDGLEDAFENLLMGCYAQQTADQFNISRKEMDDFAISSLKKAQLAQQNGYDKDEISTVKITSSKGENIIQHDEQPNTAKIDKIPTLRPVFTKDGSVTAANSSSISDGASALILAHPEFTAEQGLTPIAQIIAHTSHAQLPAEFTIAPIGAIEKLLDKVHWTISDVDLFEINEAFAVVTLATVQSLKIPMEKVNISGGACAVGHPIGSSASRICVTLIYNLKRLGLQKGIAAVCIGGGEATAIAIEIVN